MDLLNYKEIHTYDGRTYSTIKDLCQLPNYLQLCVYLLDLKLPSQLFEIAGPKLV